MARVLVIEDDSDIQEILRYNLGAAGHTVRVAAGGKDGLRLAHEEPPELVLLDLMLPDMPGTSVCRQLKSDPVTRIARVIIVSARGEEIDRVVGFELGADDYVVKPFSVRELILRVNAVIGGRLAPEPTRLVTFGSLRLDRDAYRVWVGGAEVVLTTLEFRLLVALYDRQNRVQSRQQLLTSVWGIELGVELRTVDTHVKRLREKLGDAGRYVQTIRGVGYRFSMEPAE